MNERRIRILAVRDVLVVVLSIALVIADRSLRGSSGALPMIVAVLTGVLVTVSGFYVHEWGHYVAARFAGAEPVPSASPMSIFLFHLDEADCTREQWLVMSMGGYVATLIALPIVLAVLDLHVLSGQVGIVLTSLGMLATFGLEIPITWRVYRKRATV